MSIILIEFDQYVCSSSFLTDEQRVDYYEELNKMSLEISLWIKGKDLLAETMKALKWRENAKDIRMLTGDVRKLILKGHSNKFNPQSIVLWSVDKNNLLK